MVAVDTSSLVAYLEGAKGFDVDAVAAAIEAGTAVLPPVVIAEIFSDPAVDAKVKCALLDLPSLELKTDFWRRTGELRARVLGKNKKARLADALIAQSCLDHKMPLITRDADFRNFAKYCGLGLVVAIPDPY